jgi:hypothetical protein
MYMTGEVDVPLELIQAHAAGKLVLFVGAGASLNPPSGLPLFPELARIVGDLAHHTRKSEETVDHFLGRISADIDVHNQVKRVIGGATSAPNANHDAIARLANASSVSRVITTNFDEHLEAAATNAGLPLGRKYLATALPVGRDFEGIAYIHGAISQPSKSLILTDRDFGRAYLTDAWATRFLQQVFDNFVVLFVGYSHTDPIVSYLGLGLPSNAKHRFVLTHEPAEERWQYLGIEAIGYSADHDHAALSDVLMAWAKRAAMGRLDHLALVARLAQGAPPVTPVDRDYLIDAIQRSHDAATSFAEYARGPEWLEWAENLDAFQVLFQPTEAPLPGSIALAQWFAEAYVAEPDRQIDALLTISRLGLAMTQQLFGALSVGVNRLAKANPEAARRWLILLATSVPGHSAPQSMIFLAREPAVIADRVVLEQMVRPSLSVRRNVMVEALGGAAPAIRGELSWNVDYYTANNYWDALRNQPGFGFTSYLPTFERAVIMAYELHTAFNGSGFDPLSYGRSAIEPHPQNNFPDVLDLLVDALRDGGEARYPHDAGLAQRWLETGYPLFRRLAVHLVATGPMSDSDKISWLLDQNLLWDFDAKHERFALLKNAIAGASPEVRSRLLAAILDGRDDADEAPAGEPDDPTSDPPASDARATEILGYEVFNFLTWIADADPTWTEVATLSDELAAEHHWSRRELPDLHSWSSSGAFEPQPPFSREQFDSMIKTEGVERAVQRLLAFEYQDFMDGPEWSDGLNLIRVTVTDQPEVGIEIWDSQALSTARPDQRSSILDSILEAWAEATLDDALLTSSLDRAAGRVDAQQSAWPIARFVSEQIRLRIDSIPADSLSVMRSLAATLWHTHASNVESRDDADMASQSLNTWPGLIGRFWVLAISARWQAHLDDWRGLDDDERAAIERIIGRRDEGASQAAIPAITREAVFLFNADAGWAEEVIIPLFDGDLVPLEWSWGSYLYHPAWNDGFLDRGFYQRLFEVVARLDEFEESHGMQQQLVGLLVNVASFSSLALTKRLELLNELVVHRLDLVDDAVRHILRLYIAGKPEDYSPLWDDWLAVWMQQRLSGSPRTATSEESSAWADLIPFVPGHAGDALALWADRTPAAFDHSYEFPQDLTGLQQILPEYLVHLVGRMHTTGLADVLTAYRVSELLGRLTAAFGREAIAPLFPAAIELGIEA